jgi:hypothetical protein
MRTEVSYRYQDVAHFITALVDNGTLPVGAEALEHRSRR